MPLQATPPESPSTDDPFGAIADFFDSGMWSAIALLLRVFAISLWLALVWWTYQDARRRIEAPSLIAAAVALAFFLPFLGAIIYLIVRPPERLDEARERELELATLERGLRELNERRKRLESARGLPAAGGDGASMEAALKEAGAVTRADLEELSIRLTELEFRMRLLDHGPRRAGAEELPPAPQPSPNGPAPAEGETGRGPRPRRVPRPEAERSYRRVRRTSDD